MGFARRRYGRSCRGSGPGPSRRRDIPVPARAAQLSRAVHQPARRRRQARNSAPPTAVASTDPTSISMMPMSPGPLGPGAGFGTSPVAGEAGEDATGSPEGEGSADGEGDVVTVAGGPACALPPPGAAKVGGLVAEMVPAAPLQLPPAASWTVSVGWKVPAEYEWLALAPDPIAPPPNAQVDV